ncbi:MAG: nucleotidyl transferase AbiEii/AbiGii toxin family protein [Desulfobacteraceae bacterium]|nr:nucleotidyl transferase AbiEii/AbiGii toxin family protein [Desulfobacteraceae bacterium]
MKFYQRLCFSCIDLIEQPIDIFSGIFYIDIDPPPDAEFEVRYIDDPVPFSLRAYSGPALLAEKIDAILHRGWESRVKGRDWYDFAFLVRRKVPLVLPHLEVTLRMQGFISFMPHFFTSIVNLFHTMLLRCGHIILDTA